MIDKLKQEINLLAEEIISLAINLKLKISFSESITGGLLSSCLTNIKDASMVFEMGFIVYSNEAKIRLLNVNPEIIDRFGVYSKNTVEEMLNGNKAITNADIIVAVSGIAGPDKIEGYEVGETYIGFMFKREKIIIKNIYTGNREEIRLKIVEFCFGEILKKLKDMI